MDRILNSKKIAVHIQSEVQFFSLEPLLIELQKHPVYELSIIVDDMSHNSDGFTEMANSVRQLIEGNGFKVVKKENVANVIFDLYLTAYMDNLIKYKVALKYEYGTLNIKPNLTYLPSLLDGFHGFLCQSTVTESLLRVFGATFAVDNLRFLNKHKRKNSYKDARQKKRVLLAMTYNDNNTDDEIIQIIKKLKERYFVVVKGHHGTEYLKDCDKRKNILETMADEYYGSDTSLSELILGVDACLFDNSSAIAEALCANVPCAIIAKDLDFFKLRDLHTTQYEIVQEGYIPYCADLQELEDTMNKVFTRQTILKQKELSEKFFPKRFKTGVSGYMQVIDLFLNNESCEDYVKLKNIKTSIQNEECLKRNNEIQLLNKEKEKISQENEKLNQQIKELNNRLKEYEEGKIYKAAKRIYNLRGRIVNGKN